MGRADAAARCLAVMAQTSIIGTRSHLRCAVPWFCAFWLAALLVPARGQKTPSEAGASQALGLDEARTLVREGKTRDAEAAVRSYLQAGHENEEAHGLLGLILYQEGKPADSLAEFTRAAKLATPTASELRVVGLDYVLLRDLPNADKWMTVAVQREPGNPAGWRYLGGIKYSENRFTEAIEIYNKYLGLHPRDVLVEDAIGRSLEGLARDEDAASAYRTALAWQAGEQKQHYEPMLHFGALLLKQGKTQEALPLLTRAGEIAPSDPDVHEQLGTLWTQTGDLKKAQSELEAALELAPGKAHVHWLLASVYRRQGETEKANRELKEYARLLGAHSSDKLQ